MQNLIDIAIEKYGNSEAIAVLVDDNPALFAGDVEFELTDSLPADASIFIREEDVVKDKKVLKELNGKTIISE